MANESSFLQALGAKERKTLAGLLRKLIVSIEKDLR